jgi:UPF0755 protein
MKKILIALLIVAFSLIGFLMWWINGKRPANPIDTTKRTFVIAKGSGIREISNNLKREGLIRDSVVFFLLVKQTGLEKKIQAGSFRLSPSQSAEQIAHNLTVGTQDVWVTIPEGKRAEEIAEILKVSMPGYNDTWVEKLKENEGYLFPDTYLLPKEATIDLIISTLTNTFEQRYTQVDNRTTLTKEQLVILASLIEREAKHDKDRYLISSVIHNRLSLGMSLQVDATVQYILGYSTEEKTWWKKNLTFDDLAINSPYNTYKVIGLPPSPICNPGLAVLQAAGSPADTNYLFYMTDKEGVNHYARTNAEHNANIRKYGL